MEENMDREILDEGNIYSMVGMVKKNSHMGSTPKKSNTSPFIMQHV